MADLNELDQNFVISTVENTTQQIQNSGTAQQLTAMLNDFISRGLSTIGINTDSLIVATQHSTVVLIAFVVSVIIVFFVISKFSPLKGKTAIAISIVISLLLVGFWLNSVGG